jgi:hypothetical protein
VLGVFVHLESEHICWRPSPIEGRENLGRRRSHLWSARARVIIPIREIQNRLI